MGLFCRNLLSCLAEVKETAYKGLLSPVLEYACSAWDPHSVALQEEPGKVQREQILSFWSRPLFRKVWMCRCVEKQTGSCKNFSLVKMAKAGCLDV